MCGHFGMHRPAGALIFAELNVFYNMMLAGVVRGMDGTGIIAVDKDGKNLRAIKTAGAPWQLFGSGIWKTFKQGFDSTAATGIGHHRAATKGGVTGANAHPFHHGHITMAHNGTLTNTIPVSFSVDSDWLTSQVAEKGIEAFKDIHGAYACVWWDDKEKRVNFFVNKERPFTIMEYGGTFFWASEYDMLNWVLHRNLKGITDKNLRYYQLEEDRHYYINDSTKELIMGEKVVKNPKPVTSYQTYGTGGGANHYFDDKYDKYKATRRQRKGKKQPSDDQFCVFQLAQEDSYPGGRYKYKGLTDRNELVTVVTDYKILNWSTDTFEGMLEPAPMIYYDNGKQVVEYRVENNMFWAVDPVIEAKVTDIINYTSGPAIKKVKLANDLEISKGQFISLTADGCAACEEPLHEDFAGEYLGVCAGVQREVHSLICQSCQEQFLSTVDE